MDRVLIRAAIFVASAFVAAIAVVYIAKASLPPELPPKCEEVKAARDTWLLRSNISKQEAIREIDELLQDNRCGGVDPIALRKVFNDVLLAR